MAFQLFHVQTLVWLLRPVLSFKAHVDNMTRIVFSISEIFLSKEI